MSYAMVMNSHNSKMGRVVDVYGLNSEERKRIMYTMNHGKETEIAIKRTSGWVDYVQVVGGDVEHAMEVVNQLHTLFGYDVMTPPEVTIHNNFGHRIIFTMKKRGSGSSSFQDHDTLSNKSTEK